MSATLAIDLGGTKTLAALVDGAKVLDRRRIATDPALGPDGWLTGIAGVVGDWSGGYDRIGMTVTGLVADGCWRAMNPATLPVPAGYPLAERAATALGRPVTLANDAQAAAWGEFRHGAGAGRDMVFVTVSTGIGAGIVLNGRLVTGRGGLAGHAGQMIDLPAGDDRPFEDQAAGRWIARTGGRADAAAVFAAAADDPASAASIAASADRVSRLCRNLQFLLDPEVIVIGGGIGLAPGYLDRVADTLGRLDEIVRPRLIRAALGADAGTIGIAALANNASPNGGYP